MFLKEEREVQKRKKHLGEFKKEEKFSSNAIYLFSKEVYSFTNDEEWNLMEVNRNKEKT